MRVYFLRLAAWLAVIGLGACESVDASCNAAVEQYEQLRANALRNDAALAEHPDLAAEHLRQTRAVFAAPVRARCAADAQLPRCIAQSATFADAQRCL